jgi:hypothetical protein
MTLKKERKNEGKKGIKKYKIANMHSIKRARNRQKKKTNNKIVIFFSNQQQSNIIT